MLLDTKEEALQDAERETFSLILSFSFRLNLILLKTAKPMNLHGPQSQCSTAAAYTTPTTPTPTSHRPSTWPGSTPTSAAVATPLNSIVKSFTRPTKTTPNSPVGSPPWTPRWPSPAWTWNVPKARSSSASFHS